MKTLHAQVESPLGPIVLSADTSGRLTGVCIGGVAGRLEAKTPTDGHGVDGATQVLRDAAVQLDEYFAGRRTCFEVPVALEGSPFQQQVWAELRRIPYGTTQSYGQLAARLGRPGAARAVGHANARNPIAVIVPCHRVIGSSGQLTGYGGGLGAKRHLLALEARGPVSPSDTAPVGTSLPPSPCPG